MILLKKYIYNHTNYFISLIFRINLKIVYFDSYRFSSQLIQHAYTIVSLNFNFIAIRNTSINYFIFIIID